jgi:vancomycin permeability regulator SanA
MPRPKPSRGPLRRLFRATTIGLLALIAAVVAIDVRVVGSVRERVHLPADAPAHAVLIVLGASVRRDGSPSPMLADRLTVAARLWHAGRAARILVSGDRDLEREYDEVGPMRTALVALGVDPDAILEDGRGRRTLDSMARARLVYGFADALVVTNDFHVARAVYLGRHFGLEVDGVVADAGVERPFGSTARHVGREVLARVLAFADCHLLGTAPQSLER